MTNLKPCPFCRAPAALDISKPGKQPTTYGIEVNHKPECYLYPIEESPPRRQDMQSLIDQWNTRSEPPVEGFELVTPVCYPAPEQ